jgi:hypothetical protein
MKKADFKHKTYATAGPRGFISKNLCYNISSYKTGIKMPNYSDLYPPSLGLVEKSISSFLPPFDPYKTLL